MKVLTWSLFTTVVFFLSGNIRTYAQVDSMINLYGELFPQEKYMYISISLLIIPARPSGSRPIYIQALYPVVSVRTFTRNW